MEHKNLVTSFVRSWNATRKETIEIVSVLNDSQLQFKPDGETWQPLYWEFGCIARTQLVYANAIMTGVMDFSYFHSERLPAKERYQTKTQILKFLEAADHDWTTNIRTRRHDEAFKVKWPGISMPLVQHISALESHERIHHGQFISYFTLAGFELPESFKQNWDL